MARKAFVVTDAMREEVQRLAGLGVPQDGIAKMINCDAKTLRKHCRDELDRGVAEAISIVSGCLFAKAKGGDVTAQIFWLKTRARWRECEARDHPIGGIDAESTSQVVFLPDNNRDPELTEELRKTQKKYYARKQRRRPR
jgi:hypothetical protein